MDMNKPLEFDIKVFVTINGDKYSLGYKLDSDESLSEAKLRHVFDIFKMAFVQTTKDAGILQLPKKLAKPISTVDSLVDGIKGCFAAGYKNFKDKLRGKRFNLTNKT